MKIMTGGWIGARIRFLNDVSTLADVAMQVSNSATHFQPLLFPKKKPHG